MQGQRDLFLLNTSPEPSGGPPSSLSSFEAAWMNSVLQSICPTPAGLPAFRELLDSTLAAAEQPSEFDVFIAEQADLAQLRAIVGQFAVDGLTEAHAMLYAIPRLHLRAQMPVIRILIDEFGCGRCDCSHTQLFVNHLTELGLPTGTADYLRHTNPESFAFVNIYHFLARRAASIDYYLGALAYTEAIVPIAFRHYVSACRRLGLRADEYYAEHICIDAFHARDALVALKLQDEQVGVDFARAWQGVVAVQEAGTAAFKAAIRVARGGGS